MNVTINRIIMNSNSLELSSYLRPPKFNSYTSKDTGVGSWRIKKSKIAKINEWMIRRRRGK